MTDDQATRIHERIDVLTGTVGKLCTTIETQGAEAELRHKHQEERCARHTKTLSDFRAIIDGPPGNSTKPGLRTRVDRLERYVKAAWTMAVTIVGLVAKAVWSLINGG